MDRSEKDIVAAGEDVLRAVTVVIIDIEDGDAAAPRCKRGLGADRRMVEVGIAAEIIAACVVPRRSCEGEGALLAAKHCRESRQRGVHAPIAGVPCAGTDRCRGIEAMLPKPRVDARKVK